MRVPLIAPPPSSMRQKIDEVGGRAEQPGVAGDAAHPPRGRVVDDAAQHLHVGPLRTASRSGVQLSVGAMRGRSAAGGRNVVSFIPSGSKIARCAN